MARACVVGASGFAGALTAALLWNHPRVSLGGGHRAHRCRAAPRRPLSALPRAARARGSSTPSGSAPRPTWRWCPIRTARRPPPWRSCARRACAWSTSPPTSGCTTSPRTSAGTDSTGRPSCAASRCSASPSCTATRSPRRRWSRTPAATRPRRSWRSRRSRAQALIADAVVDAKSGVSGAGREANERTHFVSVDENVNAIRGRRAPARARDRPGAGRARPASGAVTFVPHLLPLDQGLLASCYVTPSRELRADEVAELFQEAYGDERFIELAGSPPGVRDVRDTNICRIHATAAPGRARPGVRRDRQPLEGRRRPGRAEPEPDAGTRRGRGPAMSGPNGTFFRSRWVDAPAGTAEAEPGPLPRGFRATGIACGMKASGRLDLGVLACDADAATSAALFTRNAVVAAPVQVSRERGAAPPARRGRQQRHRERGRRRARARGRARDGRRHRDRAGRRAAACGRRVHRRDRRRARPRAGRGGHRARRTGALSPMRERPSPRRS